MCRLAVTAPSEYVFIEIVADIIREIVPPTGSPASLQRGVRRTMVQLEDLDRRRVIPTRDIEIRSQMSRIWCS